VFVSFDAWASPHCILPCYAIGIPPLKVIGDSVIPYIRGNSIATARLSDSRERMLLTIVSRFTISTGKTCNNMRPAIQTFSCKIIFLRIRVIISDLHTRLWNGWEIMKHFWSLVNVWKGSFPDRIRQLQLTVNSTPYGSQRAYFPQASRGVANHGQVDYQSLNPLDVAICYTLRIKGATATHNLSHQSFKTTTSTRYVSLLPKDGQRRINPDSVRSNHPLSLKIQPLQQATTVTHDQPHHNRVIQA
jgi:hypothetical protein